MDGAYKSFNSAQTSPPLMSKIFMLSRNFQLNFRVTVWKLIPALDYMLYIIKI